MASGALPPGFPAVEIDGEHYWDGGLVSNTPLQYVVEYVPRRSRLSFQVDRLPSRGALPANLEEVTERDKDIRYSSRTRAGTELFRRMHDVRHNINTLWDKLPEALRDTPEGKFLYNFGCVTTMDVVQLIYRPHEPQGAYKDFEFSRATMRARWAQGRGRCTGDARGRRRGSRRCRRKSARAFSTCGTNGSSTQATAPVRNAPGLGSGPRRTMRNSFDAVRGPGHSRSRADLSFVGGRLRGGIRRRSASAASCPMPVASPLARASWSCRARSCSGRCWYGAGWYPDETAPSTLASTGVARASRRRRGAVRGGAGRAAAARCERRHRQPGKIRDERRFPRGPMEPLQACLRWRAGAGGVRAISGPISRSGRCCGHRTIRSTRRFSKCGRSGVAPS